MNHQTERMVELGKNFSKDVWQGNGQTRAPQVFQELQHITSSRIAASGHDVNSVAGLREAFRITLKRFSTQISPHAAKVLVEYLVDVRPAELVDPEPADPHFMAGLDVFGTRALIDHLARSQYTDPAPDDYCGQ